MYLFSLNEKCTVKIRYLWHPSFFINKYIYLNRFQKFVNNWQFVTPFLTCCPQNYAINTALSTFWHCEYLRNDTASNELPTSKHYCVIEIFCSIQKTWPQGDEVIVSIGIIQFLLANCRHHCHRMSDFITAKWSPV